MPPEPESKCEWHNERIIKLEKAIFGSNGSEGMTTKVTRIDTRVTIVVWLLGVIITGGVMGVFGLLFNHFASGGT